MKVQTYKIFLLVLSILLFLCILSGCTTNSLVKYSQRDVEEYLSEQFPGKEAVVQSGSQWKQTWDCYLTDLPEVVFRVFRLYSRESGSNEDSVWTYTLSDNFVNTLYKYWVERYQAEGGNMDAWIASLEEGLIIPFQLHFQNRAQVTAAVEQFSDFRQWAANQPYGEAIEDVQVEYIFSMEDIMWKDYYDYANCVMTTQLPEDDPFQVLHECEDMLLEYMTFMNMPGGFTQEEQDAYAQIRWDWESSYMVNIMPDGIFHNQDEVSPGTFTGIGVCDGKISYGGLYEILLRLGMAPDGAPDNFSFTGVDGCGYAFSYDFVETITEESANGREQTVEIWYCMRDGEKYLLPNGKEGPLLSIGSDEFTEMTGLSFPGSTQPSGGAMVFLDGENKLIWKADTLSNPEIVQTEDGIFTIQSARVKQSWNEQTQHMDFWLQGEADKEWTVYIWNENLGQYVFQTQPISTE